MSSHADSLRVPLEREHCETREQEPVAVPVRTAWSEQGFAADQLHGLVGRVFFQGWPQPSRQVVFSAVDKQTDIRGLCLQVGEVLSQQVAGSVCIADASRIVHESDKVFGRKTSEPISDHGVSATLRESSRQISSRLWLVPPEHFLGESAAARPADALRRVLEQLRVEFEYIVIHAPAAGVYGDAAMLGHLSDGVVLVVEANSTRRLAAQKAKANLQAAHARLLGMVLSERTFPIPERIYRRL
jgi:protein-tyrosine kinase